ncbi:MAG TPA: nitroreductase/quinone reductase family protein [Acidimicrobiales bacterium]|nr:nitroreductase/quinone reductase family protein [Acidimicrobiales bacterium]
MGVIQALGYQIPTPNAAQRAVWHVSASPPGAWLFAKVLHRTDAAVLEVTGGRFSLTEVLAGIPILTVITTGARTGQRRQNPLLGVPVGDELAVIGTHFGQPGTPAWYYNLKAHPLIELAYRGKVIPARAREAEGEDWSGVWAQARRLYGGYESYARRIRGRSIHIMVLEQI